MEFPPPRLFWRGLAAARVDLLLASSLGLLIRREAPEWPFVTGAAFLAILSLACCLVPLTHERGKMPCDLWAARGIVTRSGGAA